MPISCLAVLNYKAFGSSSFKFKQIVALHLNFIKKKKIICVPLVNALIYLNLIEEPNELKLSVLPFFFFFFCEVDIFKFLNEPSEEKNKN